MSPSPWLGAALIVVALAALWGGVRRWQVRGSLHPELARKIVHVGMGLCCLPLPWLFQSAWPVVGLAALVITGLAAVRTQATLRASLGSVLGGVGRRSFGEIYFPVSVALLFALAHRNVVLYAVPLLILTLGDAAAAVIGTRYGFARYATGEGEKSVEGSTAFFVMAFLATLGPLRLFTTMGRTESVLIACTLALLVMMLEATALRGRDNLLVPLGTFVLLKAYLRMGTTDLAARLVVTVLLLVFVRLMRHRTTLEGSALLGAVWVGYLVWALGGWRWLVAPLVLFVTYPLLSARIRREGFHAHHVHAVLSVAAAGCSWLFVAETFDRPAFFFPYHVAWAAQLAIIGVASLKYDFREMTGATVLAISILRGWILLFVPFLLLQGFSWLAWVQTLVALLGVAFGAAAFYRLQPGLDDCPTDTARWLRQGALGAAGSFVGLIPLPFL